MSYATHIMTKLTTELDQEGCGFEWDITTIPKTKGQSTSPLDIVNILEPRCP